MSNPNTAGEEIETALSALVNLIAKLVAEEHVSAEKGTPATAKEKASEF